MNTENYPLSTSELNHYTNSWCRSKGFKSKDLMSHPAMDDVVFLVQYRDALWTKLSKSEQAFWGALWDWTYYKGFRIKQKHLAKAEQIVLDAEARYNWRQQQADKARNKIKELRQTV
jgi:hypothetical protein